MVLNVTNLLERQIGRSGIDKYLKDDAYPEIQDFVRRVDQAYRDIDLYRDTVQRCIDVSSVEMQTAHQKVVEEQEKLQSMITEAICGVDENWIVGSINSEGCRLLGIEKSEILGKRFFEVVKLYPNLNATQTIDMTRLKTMLDMNIPYRCDAGMIQSVHGQRIEVEFGINPLQKSSKFSGALILLKDIKERVQIAKQLRELQEQALRLNEAKSLFIANMSHEMRTPLNGIIGMVELLMKQNLTKDQRELVSFINQSSEDLLRLINEVLDFSKIESGTLQIEPGVFKLRDVLKQIETMTNFLVKEKKLNFTIEMDEETPDYLFADEKRIKQMLVNLIGNAVKFTLRGGVTLKVDTLRVIENFALIRFIVEDTGIGIPEDKIDHIFETFTQVDPSSTRNIGGCGLGLAITKSICEMMDGKLHYESRLGEGTKIGFEIPVAIRSEEEHGLESSNHESSKVKFDLNAYVLLVEDNPVNQSVGIRLLESLNCRVDVASDGQMAVKMASENDYDVIMMDCQMPHVDGYQATQSIRRNEAVLSRRVPIIALTAHAYASERGKCLAAGMDDFLAKPYRMEELFETVKRNLERGDNLMKSIESHVTRMENSSDEITIFDSGALEQLRAIDPSNSDFLVEIAKQYFTDAPNYLVEIINSSSNIEKFENLRHFAHTLKSCSATLGGLQLANTCQRLENFANEKNSEQIQALAQKISTDYSNFKAELERNIGSKEADNG